MSAEIYSLATCKAPPKLFGTRDAPPGTTIHDPAFWDGYDTDTLIYDSVWMPEHNKLRVFMPRLFNFQDPLMQGAFYLDEKRITPKRRTFSRFDLLEFPSDACPQNLRLEIGGTTIETGVSQARPGDFAGRNVIYTMLRNDDLAWVRDWVSAHHHNHGADAVLIANNGSTAYTAQELLDTISNVPGIKAAHVLDVPLQHGPDPTTSKPVGAARFLQRTCLNIVRDRFFSQARAVLVCDIDELVTPANGQGIFDATVASLTKYKTFHGHWRFAAQTAGVVRHADHIYHNPDSRRCPTKYCIVPDSFFGRMCWGIHSLENVNRHVFRPGNRFAFLHCRSISTSWKNDRSQTALPDQGGVDPATQAFMEKTFGGC